VTGVQTCALPIYESWDGRGYPNRLAGDEIPIAARVIALADTIDAMGTSRPYRTALTPEIIRSEIERYSGRQFDPRICDKLMQPDVWQELLGEIRLAVKEYPEKSSPNIPEAPESNRRVLLAVS
jgi:response regulator RpfG family c-di-GMP phosphodiesterase